MTRSMVDALSELCSPFVKVGNFAFIAAIASGHIPQNEYGSIAQIKIKWDLIDKI